jgi:oligoribonuclease NrnB/cAMP/cGMP phosphodiesterase (DHH superfamily)
MSISNSVHKISRLKHKVNIIYQCKRRRTDNTTMAKRRRTENTTMAKRRRTDNTMAKRRRTDNTTMAKRRTDNTTMAKRRRTDNTTMAKGKQTKGQTFNDLQNTTQKTGKKEQHKPSNNGGTLVLCM